MIVAGIHLGGALLEDGDGGPDDEHREDQADDEPVVLAAALDLARDLHEPASRRTRRRSTRELLRLLPRRSASPRG